MTDRQRADQWLRSSADTEANISPVGERVKDVWSRVRIGWKKRGGVTEGEEEEEWGEKCRNELAGHPNIKPSASLKGELTVSFGRCWRSVWPTNVVRLFLSVCFTCNENAALSNPVRFLDCLLKVYRLRKTSVWNYYLIQAFKHKPSCRSISKILTWNINDFVSLADL